MRIGNPVIKERSWLEKKTYYVTLDLGTHTGEIREHKEVNDYVYNYEIQATDEEINQLENLFDQLRTSDVRTYLIAHVPYLNNEQPENVIVDQRIQEFYQTIYRLGTEHTKQAMEQAGLV